MKPDLIRLVMLLEGIRENYEDALQLSTTETECLKDVFEKLTEADYYDVDIEPDDIDVTDTVTVVWKIV